MQIPDARYTKKKYAMTLFSVCDVSIVKLKRRKYIDTFYNHKNTNDMSVGEKIQLARIQSRHTQREIADYLNVDRTTIIRYENNQISEECMNIDILKQISLYCTGNSLFCLNEYHINISTDFGANLKAKRKQLKLSQTQLGIILGTSKTTVKRWENNICSPSMKHWEAANKWLCSCTK